MIQLLQCDQRVHTLHQNYNNVLIRKLLHVLALTGSSPGTTIPGYRNSNEVCVFASNTVTQEMYLY
jgi:hypothetical protein